MLHHLDVTLMLGESYTTHLSGQITKIPKHELRVFWEDSLTKPPDLG